MTAADITWEHLLEPGKDETYFVGEGPNFITADGFQASTAWWLGEMARLSYRPAGAIPKFDMAERPSLLRLEYEHPNERRKDS
jgi:hypothetical protein